MNNVQKWFIFISKVDLLYKLKFVNFFNFFCIKKIAITIFLGSKSIKYNIFALKSLRLIVNKKPYINRARESIAYLKLKKNTILSCKVFLFSQKDIFDFLQSYIFVVLGKNKDINEIKTNRMSQSLAIFIKDIFLFPQLLDLYSKLSSKISTTVNINHSLNSINSTKVLLSSVQLIV